MTIRLRDFSDYRTILMGVAIAVIMAFHSLGRFTLFGNIGVEWFLVLSAIGQYYSLKKNDNCLQYYKRRALRILLPYLIVAIPFFLIKYPFNLHDFLIRLSGLNLVFFWERTFWFVSLIVICYLITPLYYKIITRYKWSFVCPFILVSITFVLSFHMPRTQILVTRIPIYLLGLNMGKLVYEGYTISDPHKCRAWLLISVLSMIAVVAVNYLIRVEYQRLTYFFCGIPTLFLAFVIIRQLPFLHGLLSFIGAISYEIYLLHESIVLALCYFLPFPKIVDVFLSYGLAILFAFLLHWAINHFIAIIKRH